MHLINFIKTICLLITLSEARGPHHPRGGEIERRHVHHKPYSDKKLTEDLNLLQDRKHIEEHLEDVISPSDLYNLTAEQLEFHYFQVHDADKNNMLDGLEILQAILDIDDYDPTLPESAENFNLMDHFIELIDRVLEEDDLNSDGFLNYSEYVQGRERTGLLEPHSHHFIRARSP